MISIHPPKSENYLLKALITGLLMLALLVPALLLTNLVEERKSRKAEVVTEVSSRWANSQQLTGPFLLVPYTVRKKINEKEFSLVEQQMIILPETLDLTGSLQPRLKKRSIFDVALYQAQVTTSGSFTLKNLVATAGETIRWNEARICLGLKDVRGLETQMLGLLHGEKIEFEAGLPENSLASSGVSAAVNLSQLPENFEFSVPIQFRGSESLTTLPLGKTTTMHLASNWPSPSFSGSFLPSHTTNAQGFDAKWKVLHYNRDFPQVWKNVNYNAANVAFGLNLLQPTDNYAKTLRSVKYAILFIGLTFGFFFLCEVLLGRRIHPLQYLMVGLALLIFYTLLLAFSELCSFNISYLIATLATVGLITWYVRYLFDSVRSAMLVCLFLGVLYAFMFTLLQLEDRSLLVGSIGLFVLLGVAMYFSNRINWYSQPQTNVEPQ